MADSLALERPEDLALGVPTADMQATPTLNLARSPNAPAAAAPAPAEQDKALPAYYRSGGPTDEEPSPGLSGAKPAAPQQELTTAQKIAEWAAAISGAQSPIARERRRQLDESVKSVELIAKSMQLLQGLPPGEIRDKAAPMIAESLPPQLRSHFEEMSKNPTTVSNVAMLADDPRARTIAHGICSGEAGNYGACMRAFAEDPAKHKMLIDTIDKQAIPDIQTKMDAVTSMPEVQAHLDQMRDQGKYPTLATLQQDQKKLPPELQLTREQLLTLGRNQHLLPRYGIYTDAMVEKDIAEQNKREAFTFKEGRIPSAEEDGQDTPVNVRINRNGLAEAEIDGKWVPKPANVIIGTPTKATAATTQRGLEQLYKDYSSNVQVKAANELEPKLKPTLLYMQQFKKTGKSVNAEDAAIAKLYLAATTSLGNRAYTMDKKELSALPSLGDRLGNMASSFFAGKDLTDTTRKEMVDVVVSRYKALDAARQEHKALTVRRGAARGYTADQIFGANP